MAKKRLNKQRLGQIEGEKAILIQRLCHVTDGELSTLQACPSFSPYLFNDLWDYLLNGLDELAHTEDNEQVTAEFSKYCLRLEHLRDVIDVIESAQKRKFFKWVESRKPTLSEQQVNQVVDRINNRPR